MDRANRDDYFSEIGSWSFENDVNKSSLIGINFGTEQEDKGYNWPDSWILSRDQSVAAYYAFPAANYSPDQKDRWTKLTIIHPFSHPSIVIMGESESESETNDQNLHLKGFTPVHQWSAYSTKGPDVVAR